MRKELRAEIERLRAEAAPLEPDAEARRELGERALNHVLAYHDQIAAASAASGQRAGGIWCRVKGLGCHMGAVRGSLTGSGERGAGNGSYRAFPVPCSLFPVPPVSTSFAINSLWISVVPS